MSTGDASEQRVAPLALLADFPEEQWPSMDLVAEQLLLAMEAGHRDQFAVSRIHPAFRYAASKLLGDRGATRNADRLFNRFVTYPRYAKKIAGDFALFHLCDHSYSQVLHALPTDRTGVFCHDLDTFRCILDPAADRRPRWFRAMVRRILSGFQKARIVFHATDEIRRQIVRHGLIDPARLVLAPLGIAAEFVAVASVPVVLPVAVPTGPFILHVGSSIPRKRIDVLLDVFAAVRRAHSDIQLVKIGPWTQQQREQIDSLKIADGIVTLGWQTREVIAECYRRALVVMIPSDAEGFGLPLVEAIACGGTVLASDIPVLREVGAGAALYAPVADIAAWSDKVNQILRDPQTTPSREKRIDRASQFSWNRHAAIIAGAYAAVLNGSKR